jgi:hypothetical protein
MKSGIGLEVIRSNTVNISQDRRCWNSKALSLEYKREGIWIEVTYAVNPK